MSAQYLDCSRTRDALLSMVEERIECAREGEALVLDTPFTFGDGHLLRVYLFESEHGVIVSDGGFAARELEMLSSKATNKASYRSLEKLIAERGFHWDGQVSYSESTLEGALRRLDEMALVLHEVELLLGQRSRRPQAHTREFLSKGLKTKFGIKTVQNYDILLPAIGEPVRVDLHATGDHREAAIEIIEARSSAGIERSMDQSFVKFFNLVRGEYTGLLFSIYSDDIAERNIRTIERYQNLKPPGVQLISRSQALDGVGLQLQAA